MKNDEKMFFDELKEVLNNQKPIIEVGCSKEVQRLVDGEPVNINPLTELPEPIMRLYGLLFKTGNIIYFDTKEELIDYIKTYGSYFSVVCLIDYLGEVAGRCDVIKKTTIDGTSILYTNVNKNSYGVYNPNRSFYKGEYVWEYNRGNIEEMYSSFKKRGIIIKENDSSNINVIKKLSETYYEIDQRAYEVGVHLFKKINENAKLLRKAE